MGVSKSELMTQYATRYIHEVFEERLKEEGFVCPDDTLLCWYRMVGDKVYQQICFLTKWKTIIPVHLYINYGSFPTHMIPYYSRKPFEPTHYIPAFNFLRIAPWQEKPYCTIGRYSDEAKVYVPITGGKGIYTFNEEILPKLNKVHNEEDAYEYHKWLTGYRDGITELNHTNVPWAFMEEAIFYGDTELFQHFLKVIPKWISYFQSSLEDTMFQGKRFARARKSFEDDLAILNELNTVLKTGDSLSVTFRMEENRKKTNEFLKKIGLW